MPNYRRDRDGRSYFFTVVSYRRRPLLCDARVRHFLRNKLIELRQRRPFDIDAWVLLPNHLHCIWTLPESDTDYSSRWAWLKKEATKAARHSGLITRTEVSLWQARFWEHRIRDEADLLAHCSYIHWNPVRHRLVPRVRDRPWSTFHRFVANGLLRSDWGDDGVKIAADIGRE
ncbi:MAG: transposase [Gammaproteobacteria bacterium]|nr:transposase [Gammaproteobacteria bacterium]